MVRPYGHTSLLITLVRSFPNITVISVASNCTDYSPIGLLLNYGLVDAIKYKLLHGEKYYGSQASVLRSE